MRAITIAVSIVGCVLLISACDNAQKKEERRQLRTEEQRAEDMANFLESMDDCRLPPLSAEEELRSDEITKFTDEYLPSLGERWGQIRRKHNLNLRVMRLLEYKRARLLEITALEDTHIDLTSAPSYLKVLARLKVNTKMLRLQHEKILPVAEVYFAESAVRDVWSDEEMAEYVNGLIKSTDEILEDTKMSIDMTLESSVGNDGTELSE